MRVRLSSSSFRRPYFLLLVAVLVAASRGGGAASHGVIDTSFGAGGTLTITINNDESASAVAVQPDGKIVLASNAGGAIAVKRLNSDGGPDTSFGNGGTALVGASGTNRPTDVVLQPDGRIVIAGYSNAGGGAGANDFLLARLTAAGQIDGDFSGDGLHYIDFGFDDRATSLAVQADGAIVVVGATSNVDAADFAVARVTATGTADVTFFGPSGRRTLSFSGLDEAAAVALDEDGRAVVVGSTEWTDVDEATHLRLAVARFTTAGALDPSFGEFGAGKRQLDVASDRASGIAIQPDGKIVIAGYGSFTHVLAVTRLTGTSGALDTSFSGDGTAVLAHPGSLGDRSSGVALLHNGKIAVSGTSAGVGGSDFELAVFNRDGSADMTFDDDGLFIRDFGGTEFANALAVQPDGAIVLAGSTTFGAVGPVKPRIIAVARVGADTPVDLTFDRDGRQLTDFGVAGFREGRAVVVEPDGRTAVAGFTDGGSADFAIARYTNDGALDASFSTGGRQRLDFGGTDFGLAMARQPDGRFVVVGYTDRTVSGAAGAPGNYNFAIARLKSDGTLDTTFNDVWIPSASNGDGRAVIDFGANDRATAVAIQPDGKIVVAGWTLNGTADFAIVRLNADGTPDTGFSGDGKATFSFLGSSYATSVAIQPDGKIVVAGYSNGSGNNDFAVLRLTAGGSLDPTFNDLQTPTGNTGDGRQIVSYGSSDDRAQALVLQADGKIVLAGSWDGGLSDFAVARLTSAGAIDLTFGAPSGNQRTGKTAFTFGTPLFGRQEFAMCVGLLPNGQIIVGGFSDAVGGLGPSDFAIARLDTVGDEVVSFANAGELLIDFGGADRAYGCAVDPATGKTTLVGRTSVDTDLAVVRLAPDASGGQVALPSLSVDDVVVTEGDFGVRLATFTVSLSATAPVPVSVTASTADGSATAGADYAAVSTGLLFLPGGGRTQTVSVGYYGDGAGEPDETFSLTLHAASGASIADPTGVAVIANDDLVVTITTPTSAPAFQASRGLVVLGGTAATFGASPLRDVRWSTLAGDSGVAQGTATWTAAVPVSVGTNTVTVTVRDESGAFATDTAAITVASFVSFLAEGATSEFIGTRFALLNPGSTATTAAMSFSVAGGAAVQRTVPVPAQTRVTIDAKTIPGLEAAEFSTSVETDQPIVVDRTMSWDATGYGAHAETAVAAPSPTWYLAEGATHSGFDLFYLLQNPAATPTTARVRYLRPSGAPIEKDYVLPAASRTNIWVNTESFPGMGLALAATDVSAVITSLDATPIIVERALYLSNQGRMFNAGHESAGVTAPALRWFLAEGSTGPYFDLFVLIANPGDQAADVRLTYLLTDGRTFTRTLTAPPNSRSNVWVDAETFDGGTSYPLADVAVSTTVASENGVPVIVERALWWPGDFATWHEAHNSAGATGTGTVWALAEGEMATEGDARGDETYILIANTSAFAGEATVTLYFEDGTSATLNYALPANSRTNVAVGPDFGAQARGKRFGAVVQSTGATPAQIVVERAMYWNAGGVSWAAGTNALATRLR